MLLKRYDLFLIYRKGKKKKSFSIIKMKFGAPENHLSIPKQDESKAGP